MEELRQAIREHGVGLGTDIVKVDSFLNHRLDVGLITRMGEYIRDRFRDAEVDCVMTVESSGIPIAMATAQAFGSIPMIFAKKSGHINVGQDVYSAQVYSFTHQRMNSVIVSRKYLHPGLRVLIVDDFLANGAAIRGLREILAEAQCVLVGAAVAIEKGFQQGGELLRSEGVRLLSLAIVDEIRDGEIILREGDD